MKSPNILKSITLLLIVFSVIACASKHQIIENDTEIEEQPKLLFLNYMIRNTADGEKSVSLINQKTTDGKLKKANKSSIKNSFGDLECTSMDKNLNQIGTHSLKNPLKKIVEYINDLGNFEKKILELDSAQFSIRLQLHSKAKYIVISELTETGTKKHITTEIE